MIAGRANAAAAVAVAVAAIAIAIACGGVARAAAPAPRDAARSAFQEGERSFQLGKFEAAIEAYERAFNLDPQPAFIFNIALAHRRQFEIDGALEHLLRARELYRNYLKLDPGSANRPGVEKLIAELGTRIDQLRASANPTEPPAVSPIPAAPRAPPGEPVSPPTPPTPPTTTQPPRAAVPPPATTAPSIVASPAPPAEPPSSLKTWLIAGGVTAIIVGGAVTVLLLARDNPSFDGPGIVLTPE
jgi:tetratricopeptide (TPR) repeat protein